MPLILWSDANLADLLDDFSAAKIETKAPAAPVAAAPTIPAPTLPPGLEDDENLEELLNDDDFAKQLQAGMADLIGEIEKSVSNGPLLHQKYKSNTANDSSPTFKHSLKAYSRSLASRSRPTDRAPRSTWPRPLLPPRVLLPLSTWRPNRKRAARLPSRLLPRRLPHQNRPPPPPLLHPHPLPTLLSRTRSAARWSACRPRVTRPRLQRLPTRRALTTCCLSL